MFEFLIHSYAEGLEGARCGMNPPLPVVSRHRTLDDGSQLHSRPDRPLFSSNSYCPGNAPRISLFSKLKNELGQIRFTCAVDNILRSRARRLIHAHIERTVGLKTKASPWVIELR